MLDMTPQETTGSSLKGYFPKDTTYYSLVLVFGHPSLERNDKVRAHWSGMINGKIFSIYDYKSDVSPMDNTDWHIGGFDDSVKDDLLKYFEKEIASVELVEKGE